MNYSALKKELSDFYLTGDLERSKGFAEKCFNILDGLVKDGMSVTEQKLLQHSVILNEFSPVIFSYCPFYFETGALTSLSDGARRAKGYGHYQAGGWVYKRNEHLFIEQNPELHQRKVNQRNEQMYLICGYYNDDCQHFNFNNRPILYGGLKSVYLSAEERLKSAKTLEQKEYLTSVMESMLTLKKMAEKFARKAEELLCDDTINDEQKKNLELIADTAKRVPWEAPKTFYEALATLAFMRKAIGTLEGIGPNTFGRLDLDLYPFYKSDIESGRVTNEQIYDIICKFLIVWDCHYNHDMKMVGYADHELENTYTLGGCDRDGNPVYNELTEMFLRATGEYKIIFPKIKCRYSFNSPKAYFDAINREIIKGTSTILYQNDDATIPALVRNNRTIEEARDYLTAGCWDVVTYEEKSDHGNYLNILKPFELAIHNQKERIAKTGIDIKTFDDCTSFEELYDIHLSNCKNLIKERVEIGRLGGQILHKVDRFPIFSSTLVGCMESATDYSMNGAKYRDDYFYLFGFPNIVDSLLAIKTLVFDTKEYTLSQFLTAVRNNWEGYEDVRMKAIRCNGWGDGSKESCEFANRFNNDLYNYCKTLKGAFGGTVNIGHLTYTEIRWWGEATMATPDGRKNGEYFAQGLTPSRLKKIPFVTDVINSMASLDGSVMAGGSVVNVILPYGKTTLDSCEWFLRATAKSAIQSLQLNCTSKEQLLDAQIHPEKYPDLIVRVTGFSARFTALSKEWQQEVLTRNFYE